MAQVPLQQPSGETVQGNPPVPTGFDPARPLPESMPGPWPFLPPQLPPPAIGAERYLQGVPYPYFYYGKPKEAEREAQANASISYGGFDPAMSIPPAVPMHMPWLYPRPPHYMYMYPFQPSEKPKEPEEKTPSEKPKEPEEETPSETPKEPEEKRILWPEGLLPDEVERIRELGLGKVIDTTLPKPWANKKAYEAREVKLQDLFVTNEGNRINRFAEEIESYYEVQGQIEQSVMIPDKPIGSFVAAEAHRSYNSSYSAKGTIIYTRTISFEIGAAPCGVDAVDGGDKTLDVVVDTRSKFEKQLHQWVKAKSEESDLEADQEYDDKTNAYCREFLESLGGATHYVSSITLGAMSYKVKTSSSSTTQVSQQSSVKIPRVGGAKTSTTVTRGFSRKRSDEQEIGHIPEDGVIKVRSPAEAVIRYSFTPLTNLVSNLELRAHLQRAIQQCFESFKKRGPFRIMSAQPIEIDGKDSLVYWKATCGQSKDDATASKHRYEIVGTVDAKEASNFFIRPDISDKSGVWFFITTDPEEKHTQVDPSATPAMTDTLPTVPENPISSKGEGAQLSRSNTLMRGDVKLDVSDVERYVHMCKHNLSLVMEARSIVHRKVARFKLVDRLRHTSVPLKASSWLPRTQLGSTLVLPGDPYFIQTSFSPKMMDRKRCLALHVSRVQSQLRRRSLFPTSSEVETSPKNERAVRSTLIPDTTSDDKQEYRYSFELKNYDKEHKLGAHMMLFALVKGKDI